MDQGPFTVLPVGESEVRTEKNRDKLDSCWMCSVLVPTGVIHCGLPCGHAVHEDYLRQFALTVTNKDAIFVLCKCPRQFRIPTRIIAERDRIKSPEWFGTDLSGPPTTSTVAEFETERESTRQRRFERGFARTRQASPPPRSSNISPHIWETLKPVHGRSEWEVQAPRGGAQQKRSVHLEVADVS